MGKLDDEFKMNELQGQSALGKLTSAAKKAYQDYRNNPDVPLNYLLKGDLPGTGRAAAKGLAKSLKRIGSDPMEVANYATPLGGAAGVIKNVGGQWMDADLARLGRELGHITSNPDVTHWLNTAGKKYIINRAGSPADELRMLADKGITHVDPESQSNLIRASTFRRDPEEARSLIRDAVRMRKEADFPAVGLAETDLGRWWELNSDLAIQPYRAEDIHHSLKATGEMPWAAKLPPDTPIYGTVFTNTAEHYGMHDLARAIEKDLAAGKLRPEQLHKLTVEEAAKRSHAHRLEAQAAADELVKSTPVVKEYPTGFKWHELTHPDEDALSSILNKEGQEMQNCIKGYTSDVMEDGTRLFSLRDPSGKAHVNIELKPEPVKFSDIENAFGPEEADRLLNHFSPKEIVKLRPELRQYRVNQIKGKQNAAPNDEYIPYVQDFVKSPVHGQEFKEIRDLHNADLIDLDKAREHGVIDYNNSRVNRELDRIFPADIGIGGGRVLSSQHGVRIAPDVMMRESVKDMPGKYGTIDDLVEHLQTKEARPVEHGYSKYWNDLELNDMLRGSTGE